MMPKWWRKRRRDNIRGREPHVPDHYPDVTTIQRIDMGHRGSPATLWPFTTDQEAMGRAGAEWINEQPS